MQDAQNRGKVLMSSLRTRFIIYFGLFIVVSCTCLSIIAGVSLKSTGTAFARKQGIPVVNKASEAINGDEFAEFIKNPKETDSYYEKTHKALLSIKETVGCRYLYTMVPVRGTTFRYIIDGSCSPQDTENFSPLGTEEDIESYGEAPLNVMKNGGLECADIEKQERWGWILSTYKAIKTSSGQTVGFIGCDIDMDEYVKIMNQKVAVIIAFGFIFFILGVILISFVSSVIFGRMAVISKAMENISLGTADLTARIPETGGTELEGLARNCNSVIKSLHSLVSKLQDETSVLSSAGIQLSEKMNTHVGQMNSTVSNVQSITSRINMQKESIESITSDVKTVQEEINSLDDRITDQSHAIQQSSIAVEDISSNLSSMNKNISLIIEEYKRLVQESGDGRKMQDEVSEQIDDIARQSENLTEANEAIAAIAKQTNLLAMNAAIEAAHAGELGKGFGVVADEIRSLAETSSAQSSAIKELLEGISSAINGIVSTSQKSAGSFERVGTKINQLDGMIKEMRNGMEKQGHGIENILSTMNTLNSTTADITRASSHMNITSVKVVSNVADLHQMAMETYENSEAVSRDLEDMKVTAEEAIKATNINSQVSEKVSNMINGFTI